MNNKIVDPGFFSKQVAADNRRAEFNIKNATLIENNIKVDVVFLGDSITNNLELNGFFANNNMRVVNRGISGDITEYALKRFEADVVQLNPKYCIALIGINDAWDLEYDPWFDKQGMLLDDVINRAYKNISEMVAKAKASNINLIICSVLPTNMTFTNKNKERNIYVLEINKKLKELCNNENLIYIDYYNEFVQENDIYVKDGLTLEGLHPNAKGYSVMMRTLKDTLLKSNIEI